MDTVTGTPAEFAGLVGRDVQVVIRRGKGRTALYGKLEAVGGFGINLSSPRGAGFLGWDGIESVIARYPAETKLEVAENAG